MQCARLPRQRCLITAFVLLAGCSSERIPTYPVEGRVVFPDGAAVRTGLVEFESAAHPLNARGKIERDGRFVLGTYETDDGAVAGRHKAIVVQFLATDSTAEIEHDHGDPVHRRFSDYATSELEFEVKESANSLTIEVARER